MEKGRLFVEKKSVYRVVAIILSGLSMVGCVLTLFGSLGLVIFGVETLRTSVISMIAVSLLMSAQSAYAFFGMLISHNTLKHIGWAWVAYPVVGILSKINSMVNVDGVDMYDLNALGVVGNTVILLASLAIGIVLLMYANGKLLDRRILLYLSGGVYLFAAVVGCIQYIALFEGIAGHFWSIMAAAAVASVLIVLSSNFITYGVPFFLALSMKNTSE